MNDLERALCPTTPADELDALLGQLNPPTCAQEVAAAVARNPNATAATLERLAVQYVADIEANPALPLLLLGADVGSLTENLANWSRNPAWLRIYAGSTHFGTLLGVAGNSVTGADVLDQLSHYENPFLRGIVARNRSTRPETLIRLAGSADEDDRSAAVKTGRLPYDVEERLASDPSELVRQSVADATTRADLLRRLATDRAHHVRVMVASNERTPAESLLLLASDSYDAVLLSLARNPQAPETALRMLAEKPRAQVQAIVAQHPRLPSASVRQLAEHTRSFVREEVAGRLDLSAELLHRLCNDPNERVRATACLRRGSG